jgi:hypothetical protein
MDARDSMRVPNGVLKQQASLGDAGRGSRRASPLHKIASNFSMISRECTVTNPLDRNPYRASDPTHGNSGPGGWLPPAPSAAVCLVCPWLAHGDDRLDRARAHGQQTGHPTVAGRNDGDLYQFIPGHQPTTIEPGGS